jgi:hypothetical protein
MISNNNKKAEAKMKIINVLAGALLISQIDLLLVLLKL